MSNPWAPTDELANLTSVPSEIGARLQLGGMGAKAPDKYDGDADK